MPTSKTKEFFIITLSLFVIILGGCATIEKPKAIEIPKPNETRTAVVGDMFFEKEDGLALYNFIIVEANNQRLGIYYSEYYFNPSEGWLMKEGFNKRFDYDIADRIIHYKEYEFEIIEVDRGKIKYKRIK
jgi:hypothetical protein